MARSPYIWHENYSTDVPHMNYFVTSMALLGVCLIVEHCGLLCSTFPVALFDSGTLWLIVFHFSSFRVRKWNIVACCVPLFRLFRVIVEHDGLSCSTFQVIQLDSGTLWLAVFHFSSCSV